jgi:hypothetical protein
MKILGNMVPQPGVLSVKKSAIFFAVSLVFASYSALAAKISQVKNNKVMIELDGESASVGTEFFALNPQNKRVALVRVTQVKGGRAIGEIKKGTAKAGYLLQSKGGSAAAMAANAGDSGDDYYDRKLNQKTHSGNSWGIIGGYLMNTMAVKTSSMQINMTGSGFVALC